jgi:hypothetical protein
MNREISNEQRKAHWSAIRIQKTTKYMKRISKGRCNGKENKAFRIIFENGSSKGVLVLRAVPVIDPRTGPRTRLSGINVLLWASRVYPSSKVYIFRCRRTLDPGHDEILDSLSWSHQYCACMFLISRADIKRWNQVHNRRWKITNSKVSYSKYSAYSTLFRGTKTTTQNPSRLHWSTWLCHRIPR